MNLKQLELLPGGLRAKFVAAFACMSILPFLVCLYIVTTFVFPFAESIWLTSSIILLTMLISYCGFHIMEEIVSSIINLSREARRLVLHSESRVDQAAGADEVAGIKKSLSTLAEDVERKTLKVKQLETKDEKIGVYTERHLRDILAEELKRAMLYQRPCALLMVRFKGRPEIDAILKEEAHNMLALSTLAGFVKRFTSGIEKVGRIGLNGIGLILPECNRQKALELADQIRSDAESLYWDGLSAMADWQPEIILTVAAAPVDGVDPAKLIQKCLTAAPAGNS
jgi:GGDEF domain-containing protein